MGWMREAVGGAFRIGLGDGGGGGEEGKGGGVGERFTDCGFGERGGEG